MPALGDGLRCVTLPAHATAPGAERSASVFLPDRPAGPGTPLVFLPGFGLDGRCFSPIASLADARRTILWNPPNRLPQGDDLRPIADLALECADLAGVTGRFVLGGFSLGGMIALTAALESSDRLAGLVLLSTTAAWRQVGLPIRVVSAFHGLAPRRRYHLLLPRVLVPHRFVTRGGGAVNDALRLQMQHRTWPYGARFLRAIRGLDLRPRLREIDLPTLVVHGGSDPAIPDRAARSLGSIPGSRVVVLEGLGHVPHISRPDLVLAELEPFLREVDERERVR